MTEINPAPVKPVRIIRWFEAVFDALYLLAAACIGITLLRHHAGTAGLLSGVMALVLAGGDAFHLIPRMIVSMSGNKERMNKPLGIGKLVTSITMTLFYVLLWHIGLLLFAPASAGVWTVLVYILAGLRIVLCFFKQNGWTCTKPSVRWAVLRNIPFLLIGMMTAVLFCIYRQAAGPLSHMWLAVVLSFVFYIPVVTGVHKNPKLGMLMLPKTCMYIWMLAMCSAL